MQKWEYLFVDVRQYAERYQQVYAINNNLLVDDSLEGRAKREALRPFIVGYCQELGEQGWELVGTTPFYYPSAETTFNIRYIFKRPKP